MAENRILFGTKEYDSEKAKEAIVESRFFEKEYGKLTKDDIILTELGDTNEYGETTSAFGRVYSIDISGESTQCVIKITRSRIYKDSKNIKIVRPSDIERFSVRDEAHILQDLTNLPNIMEVYYSNEIGTEEVLSDSTGTNEVIKLFYFIAEELTPLDPDTIILANNKYNRTLLCDFILDLSQAIIDIQKTLSKSSKEKYVHRDIKLSNILWYKNKKGQRKFKLADFGTAKPILIDGPTQVGTSVGNMENWAPEYSKNKQSPTLDIFGIGSCVYRLISIDHRSLIEAAGGYKYDDIAIVYPLNNQISSLEDYYNLNQDNIDSLYPHTFLFDANHLQYGIDKDDDIKSLLNDMLDANYHKRLSPKRLQIRLLNMIDYPSADDYSCYTYYKQYLREKEIDDDKSDKGKRHDNKTEVSKRQNKINEKMPIKGDSIVTSEESDELSKGIPVQQLRKPIGLISLFVLLFGIIGAVFFAGWPVFNSESYVKIFAGSESSSQQLFVALLGNQTVNIIIFVVTSFSGIVFLSISLFLTYHNALFRNKKVMANRIIGIVIVVLGVICSAISIACFFIEKHIYSEQSIIATTIRCAVLCSGLCNACFLYNSFCSTKGTRNSEYSFFIGSAKEKVYRDALIHSVFLVPWIIACGFMLAEIATAESLWAILIWGLLCLFTILGGIDLCDLSLNKYIISIKLSSDIYKANETEHLFSQSYQNVCDVEMDECYYSTLKCIATTKSLKHLSVSAAPNDESETKYGSINLSYNDSKTDNSSSTVNFLSANLKSLSLNGFHLTGALSGFDNLQSLQELSLVNCGIEELDHTVAELENLDSVDLSNNRISDLSSSWYWKSLKIKHFSCANNRLDDLSRIILTLLRSFNCHSNRFQDISFLNKSAETLEECDITDNPLSQESISVALKGCKALKSLAVGNKFGGSQITSLAFLQGCTKLEKLSATGGTISDLSPLNSQSLVYLDLHNNEISDISQLTNAFNRTKNPTLILYMNKIKNINGIPRQVYNTLDLSSNQIFDFSPLEGILGNTLMISYPFGCQECSQDELDKRFLNQLHCLEGFTSITIDCVSPDMVAKIEEKLSNLGIAPERYTIKPAVYDD